MHIDQSSHSTSEATGMAEANAQELKMHADQLLSATGRFHLDHLGQRLWQVMSQNYP